jgi:hypothetical protein
VSTEAQEHEDDSIVEAVVTSRAQTADELPAPAKLRLTVRPAIFPPEPVESFALSLPDGLKLDPRGIRRCPLLVEELAAADEAPCRRSRVGSGTFTSVAPDGTRTTLRVRFLRGPGDALSVRTSLQGDHGAAYADITDDGFRLDLPSLSPGFAFGGMTLSLGRVRGRSLVRLRGCEGGAHAIGLTFSYPAVTTPDGGEALASQGFQDTVPCSTR